MSSPESCWLYPENMGWNVAILFFRCVGENEVYSPNQRFLIFLPYYVDSSP